MRYSVSDFTALIAVMDTAGRPEGWLCDGVMFVVIRDPSGRNFATWLGAPFATGADWERYLDTLFDAGGAVARLDSAVGLVARTVGPPPHPFAASVVTLYPEAKAKTITFFGTPYPVSSTAGRIAVASAYVDSAAARFRTAAVAHLALDGFYWLHESVHGEEEHVVSGVASRVHALGDRFLWVPFFSAWGVDRWRSMGFDEAWLQPNYFFHPELGLSRMDSAVARAMGNGMGLELEMDGRLFTRPADFGGRLTPYLDALDRSPGLARGPIVIYEGSGALPRLSKQRDPAHRQLYCRLVTSLWGPGARC